MTISDIELEAGLRDLRGRTDHLVPPPADLAQRTRERYRPPAPWLPQQALCRANVVYVSWLPPPLLSLQSPQYENGQTRK